MAEALVTVAVETISDLLIKEFTFMLCMKHQVAGLRNQLQLLQSYLKDADARKHDNAIIQTWVCQATRLAYRAEDTIEEYAIKVASNRGGALQRAACIVGECISAFKVGYEISQIHTDIANLIKALADFGINQSIEARPSSAAVQKQRSLTTYPHEEVEYFVGMDDDVSEIVTWVTEKNIHRVISICGMGGLGKTTIARKVYNHCQEQRSFECFAWVTVTRQCQDKWLLQSILIQILGDKEQDRTRIRGMEKVEVVSQLFNELKNKKCFVVLDDIWNKEDWKSLNKAFPILEGSSKILLTTRRREVADINERHLQHVPKFLGDEDGWKLLSKIALKGKEEQGEYFKAIGKDMLHKCRGLPLAISALGGILKKKDRLTEWEEVNKKFGKYMSEDDEPLSVLALSYEDLPSYIKPCFLYMGYFGEDEEINVMRLYQLWMADGLIPPNKRKQGETDMDVASDFLHELISRNMVQCEELEISTDKKYCRLHDLVRELCLKKGEKEQFIEVKSNQFLKHGEDWVVGYHGLDLCRQSMLVDNKYGRVNIEISNHDIYIRALMINCRPQNDFFNQVHELNLKGFNFKKLRSLILDNCKFKDNELPEQIRDMIHLRCLSLQNSLNNGTLPSFIGELQYLQTLNLASNNDLELPNIFHKMKRLRCLYLPSVRRQSMPERRLEFHGLKELEVVEGLNSKYDEFTVSEFTGIRRFNAKICGYEDLSTIMGGVSSMSKVQYTSFMFNVDPGELEERITSFLLKEGPRELENIFPDVKKFLLCPRLHRLHLWAPIGNFPRYERGFWPDLVFLLLCDTKFVEDPMPFLQELPNLKELLLISNAYVGKEMYCSSEAFPKLKSLYVGIMDRIESWRVDAGAFPKLTELRMDYLKNIEIWRVDAGAFPNLSSLQIKECKSFEIVPHGLTSITSLFQITIEEMPEEFRIKYGRLQNTNH